MATRRKPLKRSFLIGIAGFVMALCIVLSVVQFFSYRTMLYNSYEDNIETIISYVAGGIDVDDLAECMSTGQESEKFKELQQELDNIRDRVNIHFIYVIVPLNTDETDNIKNVIAGVSEYEYENMADQLVQLNQLTGDSYSPETAKKYLDAYNSGKLSFFEEVSQWGDDYTGLLPLYDSAGNKVAALCVDVDVADIHTVLWHNVSLLVLITMLLGIAFAVIFYFWSARNVTQPIAELENSVVAYAASCDDQKDPDALQIHVPEIRTANEIESLASAVTTMSEAMQHYVKNIVRTETELARMNVLATVDALTKVRNKTSYDAFMVELQAQAEKAPLCFAMLVFDLNHLKQINDAFGHEKGDVYIKRGCSTICALFGHSPVFRVGGDEFVVILQGQDYDERAALVEKARSEFNKMAHDESVQPWERCSVAIGMAEYDGGGAHAVEEVFALADEDMYRQKERMRAAALSSE